MKSVFAGAMSWAEPVRSSTAPFVVFYHRVVDRLGSGNDLALPSMEISVAMLERHLDWLGRHFQIVPPEELGGMLEQPRRSRALAAITFDDGYADVFHHAFPLLIRKGMPAGVFVVTDLIGSTQLPVHERLHALLVKASRTSVTTLPFLLRETDVEQSVRERARRVEPDPFSMTSFLLQNVSRADLQRVIDHLQLRHDIDGAWQSELQPLTWEMLARMRDTGMTIGSHSKSHSFLTNESRNAANAEAAGSRQLLRERLGVDARCFAYPGGSFDGTVVDIVASAGYRYAFTTCRHRDARYPLLTIPRVGLWEQSCLDPFGRFSPAIMSCQATGALRLASRCAQRHVREESYIGKTSCVVSQES